jgi:hypothetical protein
MHSFTVGQETIENMRSRVEKCRRLATMTNDARVAEVLRQMAEEVEADIAMLEAEELDRTD